MRTPVLNYRPVNTPRRRTARVGAFVLLPLGVWLLARAACIAFGVTQPFAGDTVRFAASRDAVFGLLFAAPVACVAAGVARRRSPAIPPGG